MMRKKIMSCFLVVMMLCAILPTALAATTFSDVPDGKWFSEGVRYCADKGYVKGYPDGSFKPNNNITRAEMAVIMNNVLGLKEAATNTFNDVPNGKWFTEPVLKCVKAGVISGYGNGKFGPNDNVTREMAAVILAKALKVRPSPSPSYFEDESNISNWAKGPVAMMRNKGLVSGMGENRFVPKGKVTRGQVCTILCTASKDQVASPDTSTMGTAVDKLPVDNLHMAFSSGAGGWATELVINEDGSFEGIYFDSDLGDGSTNYDVTIYGNTFQGKFKNFRKVSDTQYIMDLESIKYEEKVGTMEIEDKVRYFYTDAYGICEGDSFTLLLKGADIKVLPNDAQAWAKAGAVNKVVDNDKATAAIFYTDGAPGPFVEMAYGKG